MNCRRTRELLSPYSDGRLTGMQMLEVAQHMDRCAGCREEYQVIQEVKLLLRAVSRPQPTGSLEHEIRKRIATEEAISQINLCLSFSLTPQRAKRMATAVALSCFSVLVVAAPFGAGTLALSDSMQTGKRKPLTLARQSNAQNLFEMLTESSSSFFDRDPSMHLVDMSRFSGMNRQNYDRSASAFMASRTQEYGSLSEPEFSGLVVDTPFYYYSNR